MTITAALCGFALAFALALTARMRDQPRAAGALGALVLFEGLLALMLVLELAQRGGMAVLAGAEALPLPLLPVLLWRHLERLTGGATSRRDWLWAAVPAALLLPFLCLPGGVRVELLAGAVRDVHAMHLLLALGSVVAFWLACLVVHLAMGWRVAVRLAAHRQRLRALYAAEGPGSLRAFAALVGGVALALGLQLADLVASGLGGEILRGAAIEVFLAFVIFGFAAHGLLLRPLPEWAQEAVPQAASARRAAYARSGLTDADLERLLIRLDQVMADTRLWAEPALSLKDLADAAGMKPGYVSQALNQLRGVSFFDYVNGWRIDAACRLLAETDMNVLDVALAVGFNAKSTFNTAFRRLCGVTPSAWRATGPIGPVATAR